MLPLSLLRERTGRERSERPGEGPRELERESKIRTATALTRRAELVIGPATSGRTRWRGDLSRKGRGVLTAPSPRPEIPP